MVLGLSFLVAFLNTFFLTLYRDPFSRGSLEKNYFVNTEAAITRAASMACSRVSF